MNLRDFAVRYAGMPSDETQVTIVNYIGQDPVASRAIEDVYRRAHTVTNVPQELLETIHETSVVPTLQELVRTLRSGGQVVD